MNRQEFDAIVDDAVSNGASREDAEAYVRAGYKLDDESDPSVAEGERSDGGSDETEKE